MISYISPVYNSEETLWDLSQSLVRVSKKNKYKYEIILIDDGSQDRSWREIQKICSKNSNIRGIKLSKNFGQHCAVTAGIQKARGEILIILDCDMQDDPNDIPRLIEKKKQGYDVVITKKIIKKHSIYRKISVKIYFYLLNKFSDIKLENDLGTMVLFTRKVANEFIKISEYHRSYTLILAWLGFNRGSINVKQNDRLKGNSSYTLRKLLSLGIDVATSQSTSFLNFSILFGAIFIISSAIFLIILFTTSFILNFHTGWLSIVTLILFSTGLILFMLGINGIYVGKIFMQSKNRPIFIISEEM
jgi:dolichol-phosphate mannosyltransferase